MGTFPLASLGLGVKDDYEASLLHREAIIVVVVDAPIPMAGVGNLTRRAPLGETVDEPMKEVVILHEALHLRGVVGADGDQLLVEEVGQAAG